MKGIGDNQKSSKTDDVQQLLKISIDELKGF
jgi:hypothetical protein